MGDTEKEQESLKALGERLREGWKRLYPASKKRIMPIREVIRAVEEKRFAEEKLREQQKEVPPPEKDQGRGHERER